MSVSKKDTDYLPNNNLCIHFNLSKGNRTLVFRVQIWRGPPIVVLMRVTVESSSYRAAVGAVVRRMR